MNKLKSFFKNLFHKKKTLRIPYTEEYLGNDLISSASRRLLYRKYGRMSGIEYLTMAGGINIVQYGHAQSSVAYQIALTQTQTPGHILVPYGSLQQGNANIHSSAFQQLAAQQQSLVNQISHQQQAFWNGHLGRAIVVYGEVDDYILRSFNYNFSISWVKE